MVADIESLLADTHGIRISTAAPRMDSGPTCDIAVLDSQHDMLYVADVECVEEDGVSRGTVTNTWSCPREAVSFLGTTPVAVDRPTGKRVLLYTSLPQAYAVSLLDEVVPDTISQRHPLDER